ncbi:hypothetical protein PoB_000004900 [Plakobranchus ocellatus]|uniref:Uncharacterized protein n=1 Tax=Plakobranchus ocellatus TaxID=259542 RepID=A0AAV3XPG4_9GAST|nr:hypothetical protein PoB_000004900 [Plakobranchus ocellatus]
MDRIKWQQRKGRGKGERQSGVDGGDRGKKTSERERREILAGFGNILSKKLQTPLPKLMLNKIIILAEDQRLHSGQWFINRRIGEVWFLYRTNPQQDDLRLSGQSAGGGARTTHRITSYRWKQGSRYG